MKEEKAVIYARVSGVKQVREGDGLASQETRCREYARYKGYDVVDVFRDDMTGKRIDRPGMTAMLAFLRRHRAKTRHIVIIDDISRFARDLRAHLELRSTLHAAGGILESPSIEFGEDSDSILVENLLASVAQHHRQKNGEQTLNRMRGRMMNGYWCFYPPIGYRFERVKDHGKLLVRDEPLASIVQDVLGGYASGRFQSQAEIKRHLDAEPLFPKQKGCDEVHPSRITELLERPIYAGHISYEKWGIRLVPARHEPLISLETWQKIQARRNGAASAPARKDINADFPLRGFVLCADCNEPLTACWSTGRRKKYPYYFCDTKGCVSYRKSIPRQRIEEEFAPIVQALQPTEGLLQLALRMFRDAWDRRLSQAADIERALKADAARLEKEIGQLLDRIVEASSPAVVGAYEKRIEALELERKVAEEKLQAGTGPKRSFDESFEHACAFLANPWKLWETGELALKRLVLRLAFAQRIPYCRNQGYRTPEIAMPFKVLADPKRLREEMVPHAGLEPATHALRMRCSTT